MSQEHWATDTPISMPEAPDTARERPVLVDFEGFGFSTGGMVHHLTEADLEEMMTPMFAPQGFVGPHDDRRFTREFE